MFASHDLLIGLLSAHLGDIARTGGKVPEWDWHVGTKYVGVIWRKRIPMYVAHACIVLLFSVFALTYGWPGNIVMDPAEVNNVIGGSAGFWIVWAVSAFAAIWAVIRIMWVFIQRVVTAEHHAHHEAEKR
jgi:hypothetical protein